MRTLTVTNWERWQSYRADRGQPPWIKVHRTVLRNPEWTMLTDAQRGQLVQVWILAADKGGIIEVPESVNILTFIRNVCCMSSDPDLEVLENLGFISLDANTTPTRRQGDAKSRQAAAPMSAQSRVEKSSTETETETETEKHSRVSPLGGVQKPIIGPRVCPQSAKHAWCDGRVHVPIFLHDEFSRVAPRGFQLSRWYAGVDKEWSDKPIGDNAITFWRARWLEQHGTTEPSKAEVRQRANKLAGEAWLARETP